MYGLNEAVAGYIKKMIGEAKFDKTVSGVVGEVGEDTCVVVIDGAAHTLVKTQDVAAGQTVGVLKPLNTKNGREMKLVGSDAFSKSDIIPISNGGTGQSTEAALKQFFCNLMYPVGSIYMSVDGANPQTLFGGTWEAWGSGRVPVGVDANDTAFNTTEKTGGNKYMQQHTHGASTSTNGSHYHIFGTWLSASYTSVESVEGWTNKAIQKYNSTSWAGDHSHSVYVNNTGSGDSENLQPYITCHMWKRTA